MRKIQFITGEYYHIYNRGVDKRDVFLDNYDFIRFIRSLRDFNNNLGDSQRDYIRRMSTNKKSDFGYPKSDFCPLVEFIDYCLNPNHYHFILKQLVEGGITLFMRKLGTGYTNYFNTRYHRSGSLFQGTFKSIHIKSNKYLLWLSGYVNGNSEIHKIAKAEKYSWCSYTDYLGRRNGTLCNKSIILDQFKNIKEYKEFTDNVIKEVKEHKDEVKEYLLE